MILTGLFGVLRWLLRRVVGASDRRQGPENRRAPERRQDDRRGDRGKNRGRW